MSSSSQKFKVLFTDRACQARVEKLLAVHAKADLNKLLEIGTEEDYGKMKTALTTLLASKRNSIAVVETKKTNENTDEAKRTEIAAEIPAAGQTFFSREQKPNNLNYYRKPLNSHVGTP